MKRILIALCVLIIVAFLACQKELSFQGDADGLINIVSPEPITATLQGNIVDENDLPSASVTITVGGKTAITDSRGFFRIPEADLDKNAAFVTAEKPGYFKSFRSFCATPGTNYVNIKLTKKTLAGTVSGTTGGEVALTNGSKVALPSNGVVVASSGAPYGGGINVYAAYIDPTADDISQTVPGSFMADTKTGSRVSLDSYGMLAVELEGSAGEKLQIKNGTVASLTTAIPSSLQSKAPASIALWSVNETTGIWKEEGTATKKGSAYVGEVSHFSFWNCDIAFSSIKLTVTLEDKSGLPIVDATVKLTSASRGFAYGITDSLGVVSGFVPSNEQLSMDVITKCKTSIFSQNIGAFAENTALNPITLSSSVFISSYVTIEGYLVNCTNTPVSNGYSIISYGNTSRLVRADASGSFKTGLIHCSGANNNSIQVLGVDHGNKQQGTATTISITSPITNAGPINACGTSSIQFVTYTLDGKTYSITPTLQDTSGAFTYQTGTGYRTDMDAYDGGKRFSASFTHNAATTGTFPINISLLISETSSSYIPQGNTGVNIKFTKFAQSSGEFYEGTFSGTFMQVYTPHTITNGSFRLRKK